LFASVPEGGGDHPAPGTDPWTPLILLMVWLLGTLVPAWAITARRLHDSNLPLKWLVTCFIPYIGFLATLVIGMLPGARGENGWGPDPRLPEPLDDLERTFS
jgi:uncharacterized membrane protein YhaH (DUF805 family)